MMLLPRSCFLHVPKTGGSWVRYAIKASSRGWREFAPSGNRHLPRDGCPRRDAFRFAFVRHPVEVYRSYWQFKMAAGWDPNNVLDRACRHGDFSAFVSQAVDSFPGACGLTFETYVGPPEDEIEFIGRSETLEDDLVQALRTAGEVFDEAALRAQAPVNVSDRNRFPVVMTDETREAIVRSERAAMVRFGYE